MGSFVSCANQKEIIACNLKSHIAKWELHMSNILNFDSCDEFMILDMRLISRFAFRAPFLVSESLHIQHKAKKYPSLYKDVIKLQNIMTQARNAMKEFHLKYAKIIDGINQQSDH
jgi:hypothetical protein